MGGEAPAVNKSQKSGELRGLWKLAKCVNAEGPVQQRDLARRTVRPKRKNSRFQAERKLQSRQWTRTTHIYASVQLGQADERPPDCWVPHAVQIGRRHWHVTPSDRCSFRNWNNARRTPIRMQKANTTETEFRPLSVFFHHFIALLHNTGLKISIYLSTFSVITEFLRDKSGGMRERKKGPKWCVYPEERWQNSASLASHWKLFRWCFCFRPVSPRSLRDLRWSWL